MNKALLCIVAFCALASAVSLQDALENKYVGAGEANNVNGHYDPFWYDCLMIKREGSASCLFTGDDGSVFEKACPNKDIPEATFRAEDDTTTKTAHHPHKVFFVSNRTPQATAEQRDAEHTHELQVLTYDHQENIIKLDKKGDIHDIDEVTGILMRQQWHPANVQGTTGGKTIGILDGRLMQAKLPKVHEHHTFTDYSHNMRAEIVGVTKPTYRKNHHISVSHQVLWKICMCPSRGGCTAVQGSS
jgi:hypothetical protein